MKRSVIIIVLFVGILNIAFAQQSKKEKKEAQYQDLLALIDRQHFEFTGQKANPQSGPQIDLTTRQNSLVIDKNQATGDLPYFGRAYSGGYSGSDGGIQFDSPISDYSITKNDKKHRVVIRFKAKGKNDTYTCTLSLFGSLNASLSVMSNNRQSISYTGSIQDLSKKE